MDENSEMHNPNKSGSDIDWDGAVQLFSKIIASDDENLRFKAILNLARSSKRAPEPILANAVPNLVELLGRGSPPIQEIAAYALLRLSRPACGGPAIGRSDAIPVILNLLPESRHRFRRILLRCLSLLVTFEPSNRGTVLRNDGLGVVMGLFPTSIDGTRQYLLEILSAVALMREAWRPILNLGGLPFLVDAVSHGKMMSRTRAAQAVGLLGAARRTRHMLVELNVVPGLIGLLRDGDASAKLVAGNALGVISSHVDCLRPVVEAGAIPLYAELLEGPDALGKEIAEDVFCVLAVCEDNGVLILQQLVRILQGSNDEAKAAAIDVLWDISGYRHSVSLVRTSGIVPILLEILRNGSGDLREKAVAAIAQLSYDKQNRRDMAEAGAIRFLIDLLRGDQEDIKEFAAETLINFSEDPLFRGEVSEVSDIPTFQTIRERLISVRASHEHMVRSMRLLSVEQLTSGPELI